MSQYISPIIKIPHVQPTVQSMPAVKHLFQPTDTTLIPESRTLDSYLLTLFAPRNTRYGCAFILTHPRARALEMEIRTIDPQFHDQLPGKLWRNDQKTNFGLLLPHIVDYFGKVVVVGYLESIDRNFVHAIASTLYKLPSLYLTSPFYQQLFCDQPLNNY